MTDEIKQGTLQEKLLHVQQQLKAPKGQTNQFGGFNYRSLEDILERIKPLLHETGCVVTFSDEIVSFEHSQPSRTFVKATVTISDGNEETSVTAWAEHALHKKGMDVSQVTGSTSSYARKYAANGLFAIDDNKDADTMDNRDELHHNGFPVKQGMVTQDQSIKLDRLARDVKTMPHDKKRINTVKEDGYVITETEATLLIADVEVGRQQNMKAPKKVQDDLKKKLTELKKEDWIKHLDKQGWTNLNCEQVNTKLKESTNGVRTTAKA